ncbi:MAG: hypothetical protein ACI4LM_05945, partial [Anaerovoracaceae bacterium]
DGYRLLVRDINKDGVPEVFFKYGYGSGDGYDITALTYVNGRFVDFSNSMSNEKFYVKDNGQMIVTGSYEGFPDTYSDLPDAAYKYTLTDEELKISRMAVKSYTGETDGTDFGNTSGTVDFSESSRGNSVYAKIKGQTGGYEELSGWKKVDSTEGAKDYIRKAIKKYGDATLKEKTGKYGIITDVAIEGRETVDLDITGDGKDDKIEFTEYFDDDHIRVKMAEVKINGKSSLKHRGDSGGYEATFFRMDSRVYMQLLSTDEDDFTPDDMIYYYDESSGKLKKAFDFSDHVKRQTHSHFITKVTSDTVYLKISDETYPLSYIDLYYKLTRDGDTFKMSKYAEPYSIYSDVSDLSVEKGSADLVSAPGSSDVVMTVRAGMKIKMTEAYIDKNGVTWIRFDADGGHGWMNGDESRGVTIFAHSGLADKAAIYESDSENMDLER